MGLFEKLQSKLELYRIEQRYAKRKHRSTFTTGALYVDGEYVYANSTGSSSASSPTTSTASVTKHSTGSQSRRSQNGSSSRREWRF
ncbi:hypothetical protein AJ80_01731 [Polytolypa hystricis UAMH7299]|uniref:Uncharacterized protein n=1 Tax=Polytolypa hystricis (strain UAMH7299) TaxID=1447883 RepID=A0A2B7Z0J8_POLH7|nr:hypothetical protein AJ80_01731 [Polytolypa hystricis UAMH7299]